MLTSWRPRTSPTFQSFLTLSTWLLWQLTQAAPMMTGAISRTRSLNSDSFTSVITRVGSARNVLSAATSKSSSA